MLVRYHEKRLLIVMMVLAIVFAVVGIVSFVVGLIDVFAAEEPMGQVFDIICMLFHLLCVAMAIVFLVYALKKESFFMKGLTVKPNNNPAYGFTITFLVIGTFLLGLAIYSSLYYFGVPVYLFHFEKMLTLVLMNVGYFMFFLSLCFFLFPYLYRADIRISNSSKF